MKRLLPIFILLTIPTISFAGKPVLRFGAEWGLDDQFFIAYRYNYISNSGYRVIDENSLYKNDVNGTVLLNAGLVFNDRLSLGLYSGYSGIARQTNVIPVSLRLGWYPKGFSSDGFFYFADAGAGFHLINSDQPQTPPCTIAKAGAGYHICLSSRFSLELLVNARGVFDSPSIKDPDGMGYIPHENVRHSSYAGYALSVGVALNF